MGKSELARSTVAEQSAEALHSLKGYLRDLPASSQAQLRLLNEPNGREPQINVPVEALIIFAQVLEKLAQGHTVTVAAESAELTSRQAAEILNVSCSYLEKLLDDDVFPHHRVGNERRVWLADLLAYKQRDLLRRRRIAAELTAEAQEMGLYD